MPFKAKTIAIFPVKRPIVQRVSFFLYRFLLCMLEIKTSNKIIARTIGAPIAYTSVTDKLVI